MGRHYGLKRDTIEETSRLTIDDLRIWGYLHLGFRLGNLTFSRGGEKTGSLSFAVRLDEWGGTIKFNYLLGHEKKPVEYEHRIEAFPCHFGGHRYYFECRHCRRRVTVLYLSGGYYACRHCQRLAYEASQRHRAPFEILNRALNLENRAKELKKYGHPRKANRLLERAYRLNMIGLRELQARDKFRRRY